MKITGVIAEYNPFHFGHKYQLSKIKENSDAVVVIMSGPFVQRGDIAITDKWSRAKAALLNGADLVLELPVIYALNSAKEFSFGAVDILNRTNVIDELCFGSECGDINVLKSAANKIENESDETSSKIKGLLKSGLSYPAAREKAFGDHAGDGILSEPNNILAVEYIRALIHFNSSITPGTIKREGAGYHDTETEKFASASGIRKKIFNNEEFSLPYDDFEVFDTSALDLPLTAVLRSMDKEALSKINGVTEGLENRIIAAALKESSTENIAAIIKTKRYTLTRIKRILYSALLGMTKDLTRLPVNYIRVLAMNSNGKEILKQIKKKSDLTIITKTADYTSSDAVFNMDIKAQNIAMLCSKSKTGNADFTTSPVII